VLSAVAAYDQQWPSSISEIGGDWNTLQGKFFMASVFMFGLMMLSARMGTILLPQSPYWDRLLLDILLPVFIMLVSLCPVEISRPVEGLQSGVHSIVAAFVFYVTPWTLLFRCFPLSSRPCFSHVFKPNPLLTEAKNFLVWDFPYRWWMLAVVQITQLCLFPIFGILIMSINHETAGFAVKQVCLWIELGMLGCLGTSLWVMALLKPPPSVQAATGMFLPLYEEEAKHGVEIPTARTV